MNKEIREGIAEVASPGRYPGYEKDAAEVHEFARKTMTVLAVRAKELEEKYGECPPGVIRTCAKFASIAALTDPEEPL